MAVILLEQAAGFMDEPAACMAASVSVSAPGAGGKKRR